MRHVCHSGNCKPGRHWTKAAADACYRNFLRDRPVRAPMPLPRPAGDPLEARYRRRAEEEEQRRLEKLRERLATYAPLPAPDAATRAANISGERQLELLGGHLRAVDALIPITAYKMNRQLRSGVPQEVDDWLTCVVGYDSYDQVIADVHAAFALLGNATLLDQPAEVFRGESDDTHQILSLSPGATFRDDGYLFATPHRDDALYYADQHVQYGPRGAQGVLMNLRLHSALYLPDPEQRTPTLVASVDRFTFLKDAAAQFVVPAGSKWRVDEVSKPAGGDVVEVTCTQL